MNVRKRFTRAILVCVLGLAVVRPVWSGEEPDERGAQLQLLEQGNQRYRGGAPSQKNFAEERAALAQGQKPYAIIVTCADSRVPPEILFDESLGKLFVIRVAGNVMDPVVLGSIEYAAEHLGSKLLVVLGHTSCGAVSATIAGGSFSPNIQTLVDAIAPAVAAARARHLEGKELLTGAVEENVRLQIAEAESRSTVIAELVRKHELSVMGGIYNIETGGVRFFR